MTVTNQDRIDFIRPEKTFRRPPSMLKLQSTVILLLALFRLDAIEITGRVVDISGSGIADATVNHAATGESTTSEEDGWFVLHHEVGTRNAQPTALLSNLSIHLRPDGIGLSTEAFHRDLELRIYQPDGRRILQKRLENVRKGSYRFSFSGRARDASSGLYIIQVKTDGVSFVVPVTRVSGMQSLNLPIARSEAVRALSARSNPIPDNNLYVHADRYEPDTVEYWTYGMNSVSVHGVVLKDTGSTADSCIARWTHAHQRIGARIGLSDIRHNDSSFSVIEVQRDTLEAFSLLGTVVSTTDEQVYHPSDTGRDSSGTISRLETEVPLCNDGPQALSLDFSMNSQAHSKGMDIARLRTLTCSFEHTIDTLDNGLFEYRFTWDSSSIHSDSGMLLNIRIRLDNGLFGAEYFNSRPNYRNESELFGFEGYRRFFSQFSPQNGHFRILSRQSVRPSITVEFTRYISDDVTAKLSRSHFQTEGCHIPDLQPSESFLNEWPDSLVAGDTLRVSRSGNPDGTHIDLMLQTTYASQWIGAGNFSASTVLGWSATPYLTQPDTIRFQMRQREAHCSWRSSESPAIALVPDAARLSDLLIREPDDRPEDATPISYGEEIEGYITRGTITASENDSDFYVLQVEEGDSIGFALEKLEGGYPYLHYSYGDRSAYVKCCPTFEAIPFGRKIDVTGPMYIWIRGGTGRYRFSAHKL